METITETTQNNTSVTRLTIDFTISREDLLRPLQMVSGAVERRQTLPILSNVLISAQNNCLKLTATDLELELTSTVELDALTKEGAVTVSARKLLDICRALPNEEQIRVSTQRDRVLLTTPKSRYTLTTLPVGDFPNVEEEKGKIKFSVPQNTLKTVFEKMYFAMAQQDVRYYLNGMLFDLDQNGLKLVATDGHRLALGHIADIGAKKGPCQVIVPRKGVVELMRLLQDTDDNVELVIGTNHLYVKTTDFSFTTKLIEGKFPDYNRVIPKKGDKEVRANREELKAALTRAAILSNEKYRGIRLYLTSNVLKISANNPEQEEAEENVVVKYSGGELEIGFNVSYLVDICQAIADEEMKFFFSDANSSLVVEKETDKASFVYVVMPMRL